MSYEREPWWPALPEKIKEVLRFYTWLRTTRLAFLKIVYNWYVQETKKEK